MHTGIPPFTASSAAANLATPHYLNATQLGTSPRPTVIRPVRPAGAFQGWGPRF
jgi:hypothetical protein